MGYYVQIDTDDMDSLATISGWGNVIRWSEQLPTSFGALRDYCHVGECLEFDALKADLQRAIEQSPPQSADTLKILTDLRATLAAHVGPAARVIVTDGFIEGGEDDEDEDEEQDA